MRHALLAAVILVLCFSLARAEDPGNPFFLDLAPVANRDLEDDGIADNGKGGWTDEGINDFFVFPSLVFGESSWHGTPFRLIDPAKNDRKAIVMLRGKDRCKDLPASVTAAVPQVNGKFIYFMHTSAARPGGTPAGNVVATYTITYADKTEAKLPIRFGQEVGHWYVGQWWDNNGAKRYPVYMGVNSYSGRWHQYIGIWATQWPNPNPDKPIAAITFESGGADVPAIFAVTIADTDYAALRETKENKIARPDGPPEGFFDGKLDLERKRIYALMQEQKLVKGIRRVEMIRPDLIAVTIDSALGEIAVGDGEKVAAAFQEPRNFMVAWSKVDPKKGYWAKYNFAMDGIEASEIGRQSTRADVRDIGPFVGNMVYWHTYYLHLPRPLPSREVGIIAVLKDPVKESAVCVVKFDPTTAITPAIKVNQVCYSGPAKKRYAYLGWWAGDLGKVGFSDCKTFEVVDEATNKSALKGDITVRSADDKMSGEAVGEMDLSSLAPGKYHIVVPNLGRSASFAVGGDSARELYYHTMRAFLHQRCGCELTKEVTEWPRPACHLDVYENKHLVENKPAHRPDEPIKRFIGGYHDAADFDVFANHLTATAQTLTAFELFPKAFGDKDLNLPESGHGIPDILSEAAWGLSFYADTQAEDGAILVGRANDCDSLRDLPAEDQLPFGLFRPKNTSSNQFAAVAAQYARLLQPFDATKAKAMLDKAERAYAWAKAHQPPADTKDKAEKYWRLTQAWAAAELFNATGKDDYNADFKALHSAKAIVGDWQLGNRIVIYYWPYLASTQKSADLTIQAALKKELLVTADWIAKTTEEPAYRMGRGARDGGWGDSVGGGYYGDPCLRAYMLTKDQKYLDAASLNADYQLGANPLGICFITGMGTRFPQNPEISPLLKRDYGVTVKGISLYGPGGKSADFPDYPKNVPQFRLFSDCQASREINSEFTVNEMLGPAGMMYAALWAMERGK